MATLADVMTQTVYTTSADATVAETADAMVRGRFGSALVVTGKMLLGIFTERDVLRAAASGQDLTSSPISAWMTKNPITGTPGDDTEAAAETMLGNGFRHLPVVGGDGVEGIVSLRDVLSARIGNR